MNVDSEKESNAVILMNDCIHNYITVASFANNQYISSKLNSFLNQKFWKNLSKSILYGMGVGFTFLLYETVYATLYISIGEFLKSKK